MSPKTRTAAAVLLTLSSLVAATNSTHHRQQQQRPEYNLDQHDTSRQLQGPNPDVKFFFFCGSSFADIQTDTCASRQWCPSSSDDECLVPGHTCFANSPCDARLIDGISVPTYSLSLYPEYRDPTDKMFCGESYPEALQTCEAGGDLAKGRHCPGGQNDCPDGTFCFVDMPCSYFVMTNEAANPMANPNDITVAPVDLPDPGSLESNYFCGATFIQAADNCSSKTWCRTGTNQECPNGEICFVSVNNENPKCEINAIVKAEYQQSAAAAANNSKSPNFVAVPTPKPTGAPITAADDRNKQFCGFDWNDANSNCMLERFCPNGDGDCAPGMTCHQYTTCNAGELTFYPTERPTPNPTKVPTKAPIRTKPTMEVSILTYFTWY
jgi:hypothetical protein